MAVPQAKPHMLNQRGDAAVKRIKVIEKPNIIETYHFGETTVHIADNCIVKTEEEKQEVIRNLYAAAWRILLNGEND